MAFLTDTERTSLLNALANLAHVAVSQPENGAARMVDDALQLADERRSSGQWSEAKARNHVKVVTRAAASAHASARSLKAKQVREAVIGVLNALVGTINGRIGFNLLPITIP